MMTPTPTAKPRAADHYEIQLSELPPLVIHMQQTMMRLKATGM